MNPIHAKETSFHNNWAEATEVTAVRVKAAFEAPTAVELKYILKEVGALAGKQILEVGAGLGEASVYFALQGAEVVATDLSPAMCVFQQKLAAHHGVKITSFAGSAETLELDGTFDIVYAANLIHHLVDKTAFLEAARRLLKPGGLFISWDPVRYNPVINLYRKMANKVRTEDEAPLGRNDIREIEHYFPGCRLKFFWLLSQSLFIKYFILNRHHPNSVRFWKKIYEETDSTLWWWHPLSWADNQLILKLPGLRWLAWNVVVIARKL